MRKNRSSKNRNRIKFLLLWEILFVCFTACATKPHFEGNGELCGLVIDENNKPVKDFVVRCKPSSKNPMVKTICPVMTNESGLFVFYDIPSGEYFLSGEKENYLKVEEINYIYNDRTKILCLQTKSFKAAIQEADKLLRLKQKPEAEQILKQIYCEEKSTEYQYLLAFRFFTTQDESEKEKIINRLKKTSGTGTEFFSPYISKLEETLK